MALSGDAGGRGIAQDIRLAFDIALGGRGGGRRSIVNLINQGVEIAHGHPVIVWKLLLTYFVPFAVASYGGYAALRTPGLISADEYLALAPQRIGQHPQPLLHRLSGDGFAAVGTSRITLAGVMRSL